MHKRVFTTALALLSAVCLLAGCGGKTNPGTTPGGETPGQTTPGGTTPGGTTPGGTTPGGTTPGGTTPGGDEPGLHVHDGTTYLSHGGTCSCGETFPAGDHVWDTSNKCTVCGYELPVTDGLVYTDVEGGLKAGFDWENEALLSEKTIVIPAYHDGKKVVAIPGFYDGEEMDPVTFCGGEFEAVAVPNTVQTVPTYAFYSCPSLREVYIGGGTLGDNVFMSCPSLREAYIGGGTLGSSVFEGCASLKKAVLPANTTVIPEYTFYGCLKLYDFEIPAGVTEIGQRAFMSSGLVRFTLPATLQTIGSDCFKNCYHIVDVCNQSSLSQEELGLTDVDDFHTEAASSGTITEKDDFLFWTFDGADELLGYFGTETSVVFPADCNGKQYIVRPSAFTSSDLVSVETGDGVKAIGNSAFEKCSHLLRIEIGKNVETIDLYAFSQCTKLLEVGDLSGKIEIVQGATDNGGIAQYAIHVYTDKNDRGLITKSGEYAFFSYGENHLLVDYYGAETDLTLPASCNGSKYAIVQELFQGSRLTSVDFGNGVKEIGKKAFYNCKYLTSVTFGDSLEKIGESAFGSAKALKTVSFPASLKYIGKDAFWCGGNAGEGITSATFAVKEGWTWWMSDSTQVAAPQLDSLDDSAVNADYLASRGDYANAHKIMKHE